jgi:hypothetical protein
MYGDGLLYYLTYAAIGALLSLEGEDMGEVVM